jgi:hypothetical protein
MPKYLDIEVSLDGVEPRLWRRFLLRDTATFADLHCAIQDACGWEYEHLFEFQTGRRRRDGPIAGIPSDDVWEEPAPDAERVKLVSFFTRANKKCTYVYDFGDSWYHTVRLKRTVESNEKFKRRLVGGEHAFPPEDCGGVYGYDRCLAALGLLDESAGQWDKDDLEDFREWLGDWDPESFHLEEAKKQFDR